MCDETTIKPEKSTAPLLIDNISAIYGRKAVYTCSLPDSIDESDYFRYLEDQIPRSVQLDGYIDENFEVESSTKILLDIYLSDDCESLDELKDEYQLLYSETNLDGMRCHGGCGFLNNIESPFCNLCAKKYENIDKDELNELHIKMMDVKNLLNQYRANNIRNFFQNPLPNFSFDYFGEKEKITIIYRCTDII
jgi:hypothetical protein